MRAVGGIDALKKLTKKEWLWCADSTIREMREEQAYRSAFFMGATGSASSPSTEVESARANGETTVVDNDFEKHLEQLVAEGDKLEGVE